MGNFVDEVYWVVIVGLFIVGELVVYCDICVVFCGEEQEVFDCLVVVYCIDYYYVWMFIDFVGYEVGVCMKNVFVFGGGFVVGMLDKVGQIDVKYVMYDYIVVLFGEGVCEFKQMVVFMGGDLEVVIGLGGVGDMFVIMMGGCNVCVGIYVGVGVLFL